MRHSTHLTTARCAFFRSMAALTMCIAFVAACRHAQQPQGTQQAKLDSTIRESLQFLYTNPSITHQRLQDLQRQQTDSAAYWRVALYIAVTQSEMGDSLAAPRMQAQVIDWCHEHPGHDKLEGLAWNHRGIQQQKAGRLDDALSSLEQACTLLDRHTADENLVNAYINAADANLHIGRPVTAVQHYRRAHFLADSLRLKKLMPAINSGLGLVYTMLENFKEANRFLDEAKEDIDGETDYGKYYYHMTRGNCYFFEREYQKALSAFDQARILARKMKEPDLIIRSEGNIGEILLLEGKTAQAAPYIEEGERYARQHPKANPSLRFYLFSLAADLALNENRLDDAAHLLTQDIDTAGVNEPHYLALHYNRLQRYAEKRHMWREAYQLQTLARKYDDSLKSRQTLNNIIEIRSRHEQDTTLLHQRVVIANYEARVSRQQSYQAFAILALLVLGLSTVVAIIVLRRRSDRRYRAQVQHIVRLRMRIVQNRMQPHYIFNVLGTVLPKFSKHPDLSHAIELLIDVLRGNLLAAEKMAVPFKKERAVVERYVQLHHLTNGPRPVVVWQVDENVPTEFLIPAMSLQIPVENALKHAFSPLTDESRIDICAHYADHCLTLTVSDNGIGYNPGHIPATERDTGTGLRVLSRTIELLNTHNQRPATFDITNRPAPQGGTEVKLTIPEGYNWDI